MKKNIFIGLAAAGLWLFASTQASAVHKGAGDLTCGNCHTIHNSQGGAALNAGGPAEGSLLLLRGSVTTRAEVHNFCFQCHAADGAQANNNFAPHGQVPPKVNLAGNGTWNMNTSFNQIGAGGDFFAACGTGPVYDCWNVDGGAVAVGKGHSLGAVNVTPPGSTNPAIAEFSCINCHDPHGTDNAASPSINKFRNLRHTPTGGGYAVAFSAGEFGSYVGGITGTFAGGGNFVPEAGPNGTSIWPVFKGTMTGVPTTDHANSNWYGASSLMADGVTPNVNAPAGTAANSMGMSLWCASCHTKWHEGNAPGNVNGSDFNRHPVDWMIETLAGAAGTCAAGDTAGVLGGASGDNVCILDTTHYDATVAGQSLPTASGQAAADKVYYLISGTTGATTQDENAVMCLSCHFAHGGPYNDNLRWDYTSAVGVGSQTGNGIPSTRGCQLCHNRGA